MTSEAQALTDIIARIIETRRDQTKISPSWIATQALIELDPDKKSIPLVYLAAHLEMRQIARGVLRQWFEDSDPETDEGEPLQHELFPGLQRRYPTVRQKGDEPEYVRLEEMTDADIDYNVTRMRRESMAKLHHADALVAYQKRRKAA